MSSIDLRQGWSEENEIQWTLNFIKQTERSLKYQKKKLATYYAKEELYWQRLITYCNTGKM